MKVHFKEVGRENRSWSVDVKNPSEAWLAKEAKRGGSLMSSFIDIELTDDGGAGAVIVGGFRQVGTFTIER